MDGLLLAQAVETAEQTLSLLERAQAGGVPLICLAIAVVCGVGFYWQLRANRQQTDDALAKAEAREAKQETDTKVRLAEQETLLREMLQRDREAQEGHAAATAAVQGFTRALQDQQRTCEAANQGIRDLSRRMDELETTVRRYFRDGAPGV